MIIGIDAGALSVGDRRLQVGVWRVTYEFILQLTKRRDYEHYRLYSFAPIEKKILTQFGNRVDNIVLAPSWGYMCVRLPLELLIHPVDLFIGLSQAIPPFVPVKTIGCVYDLAFHAMGRRYGNSHAKLVRQTEHLMKHADKIVTISEFMKRESMKRYGVSAEAIRVCYPGVDHLQKKRKKNFPVPSRPFILSVGALKPSKQIPLVIAGFADFLQCVKKPYDLILVGGDYWPDPGIRKAIKQYKLEDRVLMVGHVSDAQLVWYYQHAKVCIAVGAQEGFCMPAVEALSFGCPVVYTQTGALPEIVGKGGIAVWPKNKKEVGTALKTITTHTAFRASCIQAGKKRARLFTWKRFGNAWNTVIDSM